MCNEIDIREDYIAREYSPEVLNLLLIDHGRRRGDRTDGHDHIIWATNSYQRLGERYGFHLPITADLITGQAGRVIMPRVAKSCDVQQERVRDRAEVFTPAWVCNAQNNLVDEAWFGRKTADPIVFPEGRTWKDYVADLRLEISCGEAPYLTSRYDAATGQPLPVGERVGLFDRKLRVVNENTATTGQWLAAAQWALKSTYGFEWQGDSLLIARKNLLFSFVDAYKAKFGSKPQLRSVCYAAYIISWNLVQMDGLKFVVPESCHDDQQLDLFGVAAQAPCPGCAKDSSRLHNGVHTIVRDWHRRPKERQIVEFMQLLKQ